MGKYQMLPLAQNGLEMVGIWQYEITQDLIDVTKPDVVFFEMIERALQTLGEQYNDLIQDTTK